MTYKVENSILDFTFWSGGKEKAKCFTLDELEEIETLIDNGGLFSEIPTDTQINDLFWFETEFLCESIGLDFAEWEKRKPQW